MPSRDPSVLPDSDRHLSRRTVVKTAAHAAWIVPAVQLATMAPALATSGAAAALTVSGSSIWVANGTLGIRNLKVDNANPQATVSLAVTLVLPPGWKATVAAPAGWTVTGSGTGTLVFTKIAPQLAGKSSVTMPSFNLVTNQSGKPANKSILAAATPGGTGSSGSTVIKT
jgi:hypothetical protein